MDGSGLFRILVDATGLPPEPIERELNRLFNERGLSPETLTLEELREALAAYLQDTLRSAKDEASGDTSREF